MNPSNDALKQMKDYSYDFQIDIDNVTATFKFTLIVS